MNKFILLIFFIALGEITQASNIPTLEAPPLQNVEIVTAQPQLINSNLTSTSIYIAQWVAAPTIPLSDLLTSIPALECDMEGNIRLRGSAKVTVLLDGSPLPTLGEYRSEILLQLPTGAIERIEVINTPGATHLSEGDGGIINIILKKGGKQGYEGRAEVWYGTQNRHGASASNSFLNDKWKVYGSLAYKQEWRNREFSTQTTSLTAENNETTTQINKATARPRTATAMVGASYNIDNNNTISVEGNLIELNYNRIGDINSGKVIRYNTQRIAHQGVKAAWDMEGINANQKLHISLEHHYGIYDERNTYNRNQGAKRDRLNIFQQTHYTQAEGYYKWNLISKWSFTTGYLMQLTIADNIQHKIDSTATGWNSIASGGYQFNQKLLTQSVYGNAKGALWCFDIEGGIRFESDIRSISHQNISAMHILPSLSIGYNDFKIHYTQRTSHPSTQQLNPFINSSDPLHKIRGNENLRPELSHNLSLGYLYRTARFSITPTLFARYRSQAITQIAESEDMWSYKNIASNQLYGIEIGSNQHFTKWLTTAINGSVYHEQIDASNIVSEQKQGNIAYTLQAIVSCRITPTTTFQTTGNYHSKRLTPQGSISPVGRLDASISQSIWDNRCTIYLRGSDIANTTTERTTTKTATTQQIVSKHKSPWTITVGAQIIF